MTTAKKNEKQMIADATLEDTQKTTKEKIVFEVETAPLAKAA